MSDLFGNHIVRFPTRRLISYKEVNNMRVGDSVDEICVITLRKLAHAIYRDFF